MNDGDRVNLRDNLTSMGKLNLADLTWPPATGNNITGIWLERTRMEIRIKQTTNGWIVYAGCYELVFEDSTKLGVELTRYLADPEVVIEEYRKKYASKVAEPRLEVDEVPASGYAQEGAVKNFVPTHLRGGKYRAP